jgi:hypothetical protein
MTFILVDISNLSISNCGGTLIVISSFSKFTLRKTFLNVIMCKVNPLHCELNAHATIIYCYIV